METEEITLESLNKEEPQVNERGFVACTFLNRNVADMALQ